MTRAAEVIKATADPDANVIWGHVIDEEVGESVHVTLIATGFPEGHVSSARSEDKKTNKVTPPPQPRTRPFRTIFPTAQQHSGGNFEETQLQSPLESETDSFPGLIKTVYDQPAIFRKTHRG